MSRITRITGAALAAAVLCSVPAYAQRAWEPYVTGVAGGSSTPAFGITFSDPSLAAALNIQDRKFAAGATIGGSFGVWKRLEGRRLRWGLRGEAAYQDSDSRAQTVKAVGTLFGQPYNGPIQVPEINAAAIFYTGTFLIGWQSGSPGAGTAGHVMPYAGVGGGLDRVTARQGTQRGQDVGGTIQGVGGVAFGTSRMTSAYVEYRFTRAQQTLPIGTQTNVFSIKPNQLVAGFMLGW